MPYTPQTQPKDERGRFIPTGDAGSTARDKRADKLIGEALDKRDKNKALSELKALNQEREKENLSNFNKAYKDMSLAKEKLREAGKKYIEAQSRGDSKEAARLKNLSGRGSELDKEVKAAESRVMRWNNRIEKSRLEKSLSHDKERNLAAKEVINKAKEIGAGRDDQAIVATAVRYDMEKGIPRKEAVSSAMKFLDSKAVERIKEEQVVKSSQMEIKSVTQSVEANQVKATSYDKQSKLPSDRGLGKTPIKEEKSLSTQETFKQYIPKSSGGLVRMANESDRPKWAALNKQVGRAEAKLGAIKLKMSTISNPTQKKVFEVYARKLEHTVRSVAGQRDSLVGAPLGSDIY